MCQYFPSILNGDDGAARWCIVFGRKVIDDGEDGKDDADDDGDDGDDGEDDGVLFQKVHEKGSERSWGCLGKGCS